MTILHILPPLKFDINIPFLPRPLTFPLLPSLLSPLMSSSPHLQLGAITITCDGVVNPCDGDLTFIGEVLESLPISARLGKLLMLGYVFNCLEECLVIAAALSQRSIFTKPFQNEMKGYRYTVHVHVHVHVCTLSYVHDCTLYMYMYMYMQTS